MRFKVGFHFFVYWGGLGDPVEAYDQPIEDSEQLHFVRTPGEFTSRYEGLLLLGIL